MLSLLVTLCCGRPSSEDAKPVFETQISARNTILEVEGSFQNLDILVNGTSIFEPLTLSMDSDIHRADAVFEFMTRSYTTWNAPTGIDASTQLYGYGYGLCHAQSKLMCAIWKRYGIVGRLVTWPQHTMAEAHIDGHWRAFDAQHRRNYSQLAGEPIAFKQVQTTGEPIPEGLDAIGYGNDYMENLFSQAHPKYKKTGKSLKHPKLDMEGGRLILQRRDSSATPPPVSGQVGTAERAHLIPLYEIILEHSLENNTWRLDPGLPLLSVDFANDRELTISSGDQRWSGDQPKLASQQLQGVTEPIRIEGQPGTKVRLHFALAGWVGDRISASFSPSEASRLLQITATSFNGSVQVRDADEPQFFLKEPSIQRSATSQFFQIHLAWEDLRPHQNGELEMFLEELSSGLTLELYQSLGRQTWSYNGEYMPTRGQVTITVPITVPIGQGSPYRPKGHITLLARLRGPGIKSGEGFLVYQPQTEPAAGSLSP